MRLYTVILEYDGGTYISQVRASDETEAVKAWAKVFWEENYIPKTSRYLANAVYKEIQNDWIKPIALSGVVAVWCLTASFRRKIALLNIVKTSPENDLTAV
jgi:hypothetical protein